MGARSESCRPDVLASRFVDRRHDGGDEVVRRVDGRARDRDAVGPRTAKEVDETRHGPRVSGDQLQTSCDHTWARSDHRPTGVAGMPERALRPRGRTFRRAELKDLERYEPGRSLPDGDS